MAKLSLNQKELLCDFSSNKNSTESFPVLFEELIRLQLHSSRTSLHEKQRIRKLKSPLYSLLFSHRKDVNESENLTDLEKLSWYTYILRKKRKFDDAYTLENNLEYLKKKGLLSEGGNIRNVLHFLSCLIDNKVQDTSGQLSVPSPWLNSSKQTDGDSRLPSAPISFNDTRSHSASSHWFYTHFPSRLFHLDGKVLNTQNHSLNWSENALDPCDREPGTGHAFTFFKKDHIPNSCFGALVKPGKLKSPLTPDSTLRIPNLPEVPEGYSIVPLISERRYNRIPVEEKEVATVDEGYVSSQCSIVGRSPPGRSGDIWERVAGEEPHFKRPSWEAMSNHDHLDEKPFISEAGERVTERLCILEQYYINSVFPSAKLHHRRELPLSQLCLDVLHLLLGIPSSSFPLKEGREFSIAEGVCYRGLTASSFERQLQEFVKCGNHVIRLEQLSGGPGINDSDTLALKSFKRGVQEFLSYYRQKILLLKGELKFLSLNLRSKPLRSKVDYVLAICENSLHAESSSSSLSLIGSLKKELLVTSMPANLYLLLHFINAACKPFLVFLEKWLYEGELCDPEGEFMIQPNPEALRSRTKFYWTNGYRLCDQFVKLVPEFLREVLIGIFLCGKSMNLLKLCCPDSFLVARRGPKYPRMTLCTSLNEVNCTRLRLKQYSMQMDPISLSFENILSKMDENEEQEKERLVRVAAQRNIAFLALFEEKRNWEAVRNEKRHRELFKVLEEEMKEAEKWKEMRRLEEEKEEEKLLLVQKIMEEEKEIAEKKQRLEMVSWYEQKMTELDSSESVALEVLKEQRQELRLELKSLPEEPKIVADLVESSELLQEGEPDNESLSQMSTASDILETPSEDVLADGFPDEEPSRKIRGEKAQEGEVIRMNFTEPNYCNNNNYPIEPNANIDLIAHPPTDGVSVDFMNRNSEFEQTIDDANAPLDAGRVNSTDKEALDIMRSIDNSSKGGFSTSTGFSHEKVRHSSQPPETIERVGSLTFHGRESTTKKTSGRNQPAENFSNIPIENMKEGFMTPLRKEVKDGKNILPVSHNQDLSSTKEKSVDESQDQSKNNNTESQESSSDDKNESRHEDVEKIRRKESHPVKENNREELIDSGMEQIVRQELPSGKRSDELRAQSRDWSGEDDLSSGFVEERVISMRKSKSESSSIKDSVNRTRKKMPQPASLFNLSENDAPLLIDQVGGEVLKRRGRNTYGHASDSVIQNILWRHSKEESPTVENSACTSIIDKEILQCLADAPTATPKYSRDFYRVEDVAASFLNSVKSGASEGTGSCHHELRRSAPPSSQLSFTPIHLERGLSEHLRVQSRLVNSALLAHLVVERNLLDHLDAMKSFLLLHDAAFANNLTVNLLQMFPPGHMPSSASPVELNCILHEAVAASSCAKSPFASNLTFVVPCEDPGSLTHPLGSIELRYRVQWPVCIVIDNRVTQGYARLSNFLMELHQVVWTIEDVFVLMTSIRARTLAGAANIQYHQVSLFRHELQQFVRVLLGYVSHQAIEGSWVRLQESLREKVMTLDDLYDVHWRFIQDVTERCFLTPGTSAVQGLIQDMFREVLLFQKVLQGNPWRIGDPSTGRLETAGFPVLVEGLHRFRRVAAALLKSLKNLLRRSQQNHVEDLVSQLCYNENSPF